MPVVVASIFTFRHYYEVSSLAHISRRELKKDEVRETIAHGAEAVLSHQQASTYILVAAVIIAALVFGWRTYAERQTARGAAALDDAMKVFNAPSGPDITAPPQAGELTFPNDQVKFTAAVPKFVDVAKKYPRTRPGQLAHYYAGLCLDRLGQENQAKEQFQAAASGGDADYASLAQFQMAQVDDKSGQPDEALKVYQQLLAKPTVLVSKPIVMLAMAQHYRAKNPAEAAKLYGQIKSEYPDTSLAQQADQELALLPSK
jgi:TolA-binding protein